jgi:UDP-N-acetyl-D-mannosaminuronate dehydrogenase
MPTPPQDTGDTRETPAIDVCKGLLRDGARCVVYDPKVGGGADMEGFCGGQLAVRAGGGRASR